MGRDSSELLYASFRISPETIDAADVLRASGEDLSTMLDTKVLRVAYIKRSHHSHANHQSGPHPLEPRDSEEWPGQWLFAGRHNLFVDFTVSLEQAKDDGLTRGSAPPLATYATFAEVAFVYFDFSGRKRRAAFAILSHTLSDFLKDRVYTLTCQIN